MSGDFDEDRISKLEERVAYLEKILISPLCPPTLPGWPQPLPDTNPFPPPPWEIIS